MSIYRSTMHAEADDKITVAAARAERHWQAERLAFYLGLAVAS